MSILIVERGPNVGMRIPLTVFPVRIGRDYSNDIVIADEEISRFQLRIKQRGRIYVVEDLESRNGTYINGDRVVNSVIRSGDKLMIGGTELIFLASEVEIEIGSDLSQFDITVAEENSSVQLIQGLGDTSPRAFVQKPTRLSQQRLLDGLQADANDLKKVFEIHGNLLLCKDLEEGAKLFLKYVSQIMPGIARAAFFYWSDSLRQITPVAVKHLRTKTAFEISQRLFEDVLTRKQGLLIPARREGPAPKPDRAILPMLNDNNVTCILQLEGDLSNPAEAFPLRELSLIQTLLYRCASGFDNFILRREVDRWLTGIVEMSLAAIEAKDTYTRGHSERVSRYAMALADEIKLDRETKKLLMVSSLCHDIGKIGVADAVLKKASLLSTEEYAEMKHHPAIGSDIMRHLPNARRFLSGIRHHHEKWDGTGYPDGLKGEEIPFFGRIVAISDVFDAMISGRVYSGFLGQAEAAEKIVQEVDLFDPEIIKAFERAHNSGALTIKTDTQNQLSPILSEGKTAQFFVGTVVAPPKSS